MNAVQPQYDLAAPEFTAIAKLLYEVCGIDLHDGKQGLVQTRLARRLRDLGLDGYRAYLDYLKSDAGGRELSTMVDLLTTNKTEFFRENQHFVFLREQVVRRLAPGAGLRVWSAGCSSGEEPYTLSILLHEELPDLHRREVRILATDISSRVLATAREGVYSAATLASVEPGLRRKYFAPVAGAADQFRVQPALQKPIRFARLNLMAEWPMRGPFDAILCRNVMIYFDRPTQERLVQRFWELLAPGGYFFTGHSESLNPIQHRFTYVQPAVYRR